MVPLVFIDAVPLVCTFPFQFFLYHLCLYLTVSEITGVFIRKITVYLSKLTFPQSVKVYRLYQQYYLADKNSLKDVNSERSPILPSILEEDSNNQLMDSDKPSCSPMNITEINDHCCNIEISVITQNPFTNPIVALFGVDSPP